MVVRVLRISHKEINNSNVQKRSLGSPTKDRTPQPLMPLAHM